MAKKEAKPMLEITSLGQAYDLTELLFQQAVDLRDQAQTHLSTLLEFRQALQIQKIKEDVRNA